MVKRLFVAAALWLSVVVSGEWFRMAQAVSRYLDSWRRTSPGCVLCDPGRDHPRRHGCPGRPVAATAADALPFPRTLALGITQATGHIGFFHEWAGSSPGRL